ncbi:WecB/TagA/CpsF family glycosyltransferase [Scopulibacillus cellulosilyticus]|uniref:N-acetylglucosaminyldiphosphoundecaprenol N-acetyl-beta-D-mannosaminyltransferase n=1 Tax=Scopulibacillus cellulosilyticus TaxID=2665665 RepID=A0ABW2PZ67_9BACL
MNSETILGVNVTPLNHKEITNAINQRIKAELKSTIVAINPEKIIKANKNQELLALLNSATYQIPDGIGVILASKLRKGALQSRVTGIDLMERLLELADTERYRIYLYGAHDSVVSKAVQVIKTKYTNIELVGYMHGYEQNTNKIIRDINNCSPDLLFVALGSPRQEFWIKENMDRLNVKVVQGVGGSFDVLSGKVKRAPKAFRNMGLEWFYRLMTNPSRFRRQLVLPAFLLKVLLKRKENSPIGEPE